MMGSLSEHFGAWHEHAVAARRWAIALFRAVSKMQQKMTYGTFYLWKHKIELVNSESDLCRAQHHHVGSCLFPRLYLLNITNALETRGDACQVPGTDELHLCLPGPAHWWTRLLVPLVSVYY